MSALSRGTLPHPHLTEYRRTRYAAVGRAPGVTQENFLVRLFFLFFQAYELGNREVGQIHRWMCCG